MIVHKHSDKEKSSHIAHIQNDLDNISAFQPLAAIFHALSSTTSLRLFWLLCHEETDAAGLSALLGEGEKELAVPLQELCACGLVVRRREKDKILYKTSPAAPGAKLHELIELMLNVTCPDEIPATLMEQVHDYLLEHLDQHITIEALSERFLVNSTTLKEGFKAIYGTSLAAHVKEHRMEKAARLLRSTDASIADIARAVGYTSQSRFSAAFKEQYHMLPRDYRKQ